jgi:cyanoexosortase B-associated protein
MQDIEEEHSVTGLQKLSRRWYRGRVGLALFILAIALFIQMPNYVTGNWSWTHPAEVAAIRDLRDLREQGLEVPGWTTLDQRVGEIGGRTWSIQTLTAASPDLQAQLDTNDIRLPIYLFLRPQTWHSDQPQVEWMDINGLQRWTTDSYRRLHVPVHDANAALPESSDFLTDPTSVNNSATIETQYFRGWNSQGTYAVLQWYAWANGGHPATSRWFWTDQMSQWRDRQRMPWIAVCVLIPIRPVGDITVANPLAERLAKAIQQALETQVLSHREIHG